MDTNGTLLYCQSFEHPDKPQVLGRLLTNGDLLVLRFHSGTTVLHCNHYELYCGCGFFYHIDCIQGSATVGTGMKEL